MILSSKHLSNLQIEKYENTSKLKHFIHLILPGETLIVSTALAPPPKKHVQINYPPHQTTNSAPPILIVRNNNSGIKMQKSANEVSSNISTRYVHSMCIQ